MIVPSLPKEVINDCGVGTNFMSDQIGGGDMKLVSTVDIVRPMMILILS